MIIVDEYVRLSDLVSLAMQEAVSLGVEFNLYGHGYLNDYVNIADRDSVIYGITAETASVVIANAITWCRFGNQFIDGTKWVIDYGKSSDLSK